MSLQLLAKQMESKGRDGDSVLVHMTPGEVAGLQKLAESAGGSLSVNPETGLVEASFLKSILPTLVGAGVSAYFGPMAGAAAGAAIGGYQARRNNQDVGMGALMGGVGGYGGSQLAAGAGFGVGAKELTGKQLFRSGLMAISPMAAAPTQQQQSPYPLMSMDINRSSAPFQDIQAYQGRAPKYTGGAGNVYIPLSTVSAAKGGEVNMASGGAFEDIRAYEGAMPSYSYVDGNFIRSATQPVVPARPQGLLAGLLPPKASQPLAPAPVIRPPVSQPMMGGDGGGYTPNPDFVTPEQQSAFYRDPENSRYAAITQAAQRNNPFASLQERMDPGFTERQGIIAAGLNPNQDFGVPGFDYSGDYDSFAGDRVSPGTGYSADNSAEMGPDVSPGTGYSADNSAETNRGDDVGGESGPGADSMAQGGLLGLAKGGMRSGGFVVPADVVSMIGEGNTDAGYKRIKAMVPSATAIKGKDGGQSDTVKTSIEGKQPARVAHGEMYIPPETVKSLGGAKKLYAMMDRVRQQATGSKKQIKPVNLKRAMA
jgi:hypothetical protein